MALTLRMIGAAAVLALITGAGAWGYRAGRSAAEAEHNAERLARIEAARKLDAQRIAAAQERDALARQLEEAAHADPVVIERCLGPKRVLRLNRLR